MACFYKLFLAIVAILTGLTGSAPVGEADAVAVTSPCRAEVSGYFLPCVGNEPATGAYSSPIVSATNTATTADVVAARDAKKQYNGRHETSEINKQAAEHGLLMGRSPQAYGNENKNATKHGDLLTYIAEVCQALMPHEHHSPLIADIVQICNAFLPYEQHGNLTAADAIKAAHKRSTQDSAPNNSKATTHTPLKRNAQDSDLVGTTAHLPAAAGVPLNKRTPADSDPLQVRQGLQYGFWIFEGTGCDLSDSADLLVSDTGSQFPTGVCNQFLNSPLDAQSSQAWAADDPYVLTVYTDDHCGTPAWSDDGDGSCHDGGTGGNSFMVVHT